MLIEKTLRNSVIAFAAISVLTVLLSSIPARAQDGAASYAFLIGSGSLCDAGDSGACPAVVKSEGGDTFEIGGAGLFNPRQKTVILGSGAFRWLKRGPEARLMRARSLLCYSKPCIAFG